MRLIFFQVLFFFGVAAFGQNSVRDSSNSCMTAMKWLSKQWQLDSTGNNGFRKQNSKTFLKCDVQKIDSAKVLHLLGKPNQIWRTTKTVQFLYNHYDIRTLPQNYEGPQACTGISFNFKEESGDLISVSEFDIDL